MSPLPVSYWLPDDHHPEQPNLRIKTESSESSLEHADAGFEELIKPFLAKYCLACHQGVDSESGIDLVPLVAANSLTENRDLWEQTFQAIDDGYMPPDSHKSIPENTEIAKFKEWFLNTTARTHPSAQSRSTMRRLNRSEFENTIRDLFRLERDAFDSKQHLVLNDQYFQPQTGRMPDYVMAFSHFGWSHRSPPAFPGVPMLPSDPAIEHGFDTNSSNLSFSPLQLERYFVVVDKLLNHPALQRSSPVLQELISIRATTIPEQLEEAQQALNTFLSRAFRRSISKPELETWLACLERQLRTHGSGSEAMKSTVMAILLSPNFLFRTETSESHSSFDDYAIACRLSYFLWGTMPDDELFRLARQGRLHRPEEVRAQIKRMLADRKARSLSSSFGVQWLKTGKAVTASPDKRLFHHYHDRLAMSPPGVSMAIEQMLLFETILVENRSILEFIDTDFAYLNRLLMDWYGLDPETLIGFVPKIADYEDFFRIQWPDKLRGGILSSGATMLLTSTTERTSPVFRGAWILDVVFNQPPSPPPADTPALAGEHPENRRPTNIRERLAIHRLNANCAACHDKMDPLGLALEGFDPVGQLRTEYRDGTPIDTSAQISGMTIDGIVELKQYILDQRELYVTGFVEHLMEYAMGRTLRSADSPVVSEIVKTTGKKRWRMSFLIEEVAMQAVFPNRPPIENPPRRLGSLGLNRK